MDIVGYVRRFMVIVCMMVLLVSNIVISSVLSASKHGCAPATPPPVAGTLAQPKAIAHIVFINEVLSNPGSVWSCSGQGTDASANIWVELYNPQNEALDLYGARGSLDTGLNTDRSYFPMGSAIAAHGFLVIFPKKFAQTFTLTSSSTLRLLFGDTLIDQVTLMPLVSDTSYARMPDGGDSWQVTDAPTIDASNVTPKPTPTLTHTPKPSSTKTDSQKSSTPSTISTLDRITINTNDHTTDIQPAWNVLSVPTTMPSVPEVTTQGTVSNSTPQAADTADLPQKVFLTSLATASLLALLWVSRFFRRVKKFSETSPEASPALGNDESSAETVSIPILPDDSPPRERK